MHYGLALRGGGRGERCDRVYEATEGRRNMFMVGLRGERQHCGRLNWNGIQIKVRLRGWIPVAVPHISSVAIAIVAAITGSRGTHVTIL